MTGGSSDDADTTAETALRCRVKAALFEGERLKTLGRFEIVERLGAGGMGVVYRARDPSLDRDVAIKVLSAFGSLGTTGRTRLQREARAMAKLSHPNVAHVYEVAAEGDEVYVAMEYIDGPTLGAWTQAHRDDPQAVLAMYRAAGEGLGAAHEAGFVHRDFKPDNVLVGSDERPRVLDFGLATALADGKQELDDTRPPEVDNLEKSLTVTGTIMGTPAYMAPEQFLGKATDQRTDQFAFCVALWEALSGSRPFDADTFADLSEAVVHGRVAEGPIEGIPPRVEAVLRRGLAVDPEQRFANMRALLTALENDRGHPQRGVRWMALLGAGLALAVFGLYAAGGDDPPEADVTESPDLAPEGPAASEEPTPPEPLDFEILTHTTGYGVSEEALHSSGDRYLYRAEGGYWLARFDGGLPQRLPFPAGDFQSMAFHGPDQYVALQDGSTPVAIVLGKPPRPLPFRTPPGTMAIALSPSADALLSATYDSVFLGRPRTDPVRIVKKGRAIAMKWSADGRRFALLVEQTELGKVQLWLFSAAGKRIAYETISPTHGMTWLGPDRLVVGANDGGKPIGLQCYRATDDGLGAGDIVPVPDIASPRYSLHGASNGRLLVELETSTRGDVAIVSLDDSGERREVAPGMQAHSREPEWLDDQHLTLLSDRFGSPMLFVYDLATGQTGDPHPIPGKTPRHCAAFGDGHVLCRVASDEDGTVSLATFAEGDGWKALEVGQWAQSVTAVGCDREGRCFATAAPRALVVRSLDPVTGVSEVVQPCPDTIACRRRWSVTSDGASLLTRNLEQNRLAWFDVRTGETRFRDIEQSEGYIVQSAAESDGRVVATQMVVGVEPEAGATYRIVEITDDGPRALVSHDREWMIKPRFSPDGKRLAFAFLSFHLEVATADASHLCR